MKTVNDICYEWFNSTSRKDWDDWNLYGALAELRMLKNDKVLPIETTAFELYDCMKRIISEYDDQAKGE